MQNLAVPRWDLLKLGNYGTFTIQTTRGCPYSCEFCTVQKFNGRKYRRKPMANIAEEFRCLKEFINHKDKTVFLVDDNITADRKFAKELFTLIKPFGIKWICQSPGKIADDEEILDLMKQAGCSYIAIGFESISKENIASMNKDQVNKVEEYENYIEKIHAAGIAVYGLFMIGNDFDSEKSLWELPEFIEKNNIILYHLPIVTPFPGTTFYERLKKENRLNIDNFWMAEYTSKQLEPVLLKPKNISEQRLREVQIAILLRLNDLDALLARLRKAWARGILIGQGMGCFLKTKVLAFYLLAKNFKHARKRNFLLKCIFSRFNQNLSSIALALNNYSHTEEKAALFNKIREEANAIY
jgi:radical SAM superfamily enzyme YgiQ (UPF0313 family)